MATMTRAIPPIGLLLAFTAATAGARAETYEAPLAVRSETAAAAFAEKPRVEKTAESVRITFAVKEPTDVEVAMLDSEGNVVRHLAAGLLGEHAPAPFQKGSLRQDLTWDRKDDAGKPVEAASVRVRLGLEAELEKYLGRSHNNFDVAFRGMTVGPGGELFVLLSYFNGKTEVRVFDREGKYLRTVLPYPANTPPERTTPMGELIVEGQRLPIVFNGHSQTLAPLTASLREQQMVFSPRGHLLLVSGVGNWAENGPPQHLLALHPQGGAPEETGFVGPRIRAPVGYLGGGAGDTKAWAFSAVATSPDGKWVYLTNVLDGKATPGPTRKQFNNRHAVYRLKWTDQELGKPFLGAGEPGEDHRHFNWPRGLATDPDGNLYVCDHFNHRVMVFTAGGELLGKIAIDDPHQIAVHPATRAIYVLSTNDLTAAWGDRCGRVTKFSPLKEGKSTELAAFSTVPHLGVLPQGTFRPERPFPWAMALDAAAEPPRLWVALVNERKYGWDNTHVSLVPVVDKGEALEVGQDVTDDGGLPWPTFLAADPAHKRIVAKGRTALYGLNGAPRKGGYVAIEIPSGETSPLPKSIAKRYEVALDSEGSIYGYGPWASNAVLRFDPEGRPLPFASSGDSAINVPFFARGEISGRGLAIGPDGTVYAIANQFLGGGGQSAARLMVYAPDGTLREDRLVSGLGVGDGGVGVDASGNVYVGANVKPADRPYPAEFAEVLPGAQGRGPASWWWWHDALRGAKESGGKRPVPWCYPYQNPYLWHWGAVLKFGTEGGTVWRRPKRDEYPAAPLPGATFYRSGYLDREAAVAGAEWRYAGFGPCSASGHPWGDPGCACYQGRFAVDPYGRVFLPNPFRFCVEVTDTGGNRLMRFGAYGNADSAGPGSQEPEPPIAFGFPFAVAKDENRVYVSDILNHRLASIRLRYAVEESCAIE